MRIVYALNSICYWGGIERVTISKANALAEMADNEVWIIVTDHYRVPVLPLSPKVKVLDLKIGYYQNQSANPIIEIFREGIKRQKHKLQIRQVLERLRPDVVISVGHCEKYFLPKLKISSNPVFIREIHFYKHYRRNFASSGIKKIIARLSEWYDYGWRINSYDAIVSLTESDKRLYWNGHEKIKVMPNPIIQRPAQVSNGDNKVVMAVGRLEPEKNFRSLLDVWQFVEKKYPEWTLCIWGDGSQLESLVQHANTLGVNNVCFKGYSKDVIEHYAEASILAVTSRHEGFGMMIVEAMAAGLPIVSYDCPCGPREIIDNGKDGFLIKCDDEKEMTEKICWLIEHEFERKRMGKAALKKSVQYDLDIVASRWMSLFQELIHKRRMLNQ